MNIKKEEEKKKEMRKEDPNDPFDRQRCILNWNQKVIENETCLVLGAGGIGSTVALALCRLGVKKIYILDRDQVETSNLNRQILFGIDDVGKNKVDAAVETLKKRHNIGKTEIVPMHMDALENWDKIVKAAKDSTVVFNGIDVGEQFDYAVYNLCAALEIPSVSGSSFARQWLVEFYTGKGEHSTFTVQNAFFDKDIKDKLSIDKIVTYKKLDFIKPDENPPTRNIGSNVLVCCTGALMTVNAWAQHLIGNTMPNFSKCDIASFWNLDDVFGWPHPELEDKKDVKKEDKKDVKNEDKKDVKNEDKKDVKKIKIDKVK